MNALKASIVVWLAPDHKVDPRPPLPNLYKGGINPPKNRKKGVDQKLWVKRGWFARRGDHFERVDQSQKVKFLK